MNEKPAIENRQRKIAIVGAGPAGASLAIRLTGENFKVTLIERERFPRHKLCGEFISPECLKHFRQLGVLTEMLAAGGERIAETVFYAPGGASVSVPSAWFDSAEAALSLSRAEMDFQLLERAKSVGVEVLEENSVVGFLYEDGEIRGVKLRTKDGAPKQVAADLFVDATGRAAVLRKLIEKDFQRREIKKQRTASNGRQRKLVGFKAHLRNVNLPRGACEIYFFEGGYGGLSFVENGAANFCFLMRSEAVKKFSGDANRIIREVVFENRRARRALENAAPVNDWLAVSVESFGAKDLRPAQNVFAVGDAGAFIDPFTGSGMLMALESAEILAGAIAENPSSFNEIAEQYEKLHRGKFQNRLRVCALMRRAAFAPLLAKTLISVLSLSARARETLARATRQKLSPRER